MDFRAEAVFSDHMVLQRDTPVPIWGQTVPICMEAPALPPLFYYLRRPWFFVGGGAAIVSFSYAIRPAFIKLEKK